MILNALEVVNTSDVSRRPKLASDAVWFSAWQNGQLSREEDTMDLAKAIGSCK